MTDEQLPGGIRLTVVERCELYGWKDACVDAAIKRTEAVSRQEIDRLRMIEAAAKNLITQKGRHNTQKAYEQLAALVKQNGT